MSVSYICDGCDEPVAEPKVSGHVTIRHYCPTCDAKADTFLKAEEILRKGLVEKFVKDRQKLIDKFSVDGFKLPDIA